MHAFLIVGTANFQPTAANLAKKLKAKILEYPLAKIEDARNLNNLIRLTFDEPTLFILNDIHEATEEALNAFLKNLEEPQENVYFALTAPSVRKVLPTIVSRCEITRVLSTEYKVLSTDIEDFLNMPTGEKLAYIDKIKDREKAVKFAENTLLLLHSKLHEKEVKYKIVAGNIEVATKALSRLKANGNVNLQLTNMVIELKN